MIEFTLSRVVLCSCGVAMMLCVTGALAGIYDSETSATDGDLADRISHMLDVFDSSETDEIILDGSMILPEGYHLRVKENYVEIYNGESKHVSATGYGGSFELSWNGTAVVTHRRSRRSS